MPLRIFDRHIESEGRALTLARTVPPERTSHQFRSQGAAVQAEAMPILFGGEALGEDASEMLSFDPHTSIVNLQTYPALYGLGQANPEGQAMLALGVGPHGMHGIADEIDQNLQHLVSI